MMGRHQLFRQSFIARSFPLCDLRDLCGESLFHGVWYPR